MRACGGNTGRVFIIRFDDGDRLPSSLEAFARRRNIQRAVCFILGCLKSGSRIVSGPKRVLPRGLVPILETLKGHHELLGIGLIFPDEKGNPRLHMHAALGRRAGSLTGCTRPGVEIWKLGEMVLLEITGSRAIRRIDKSGVAVLRP